MDLYEAIEKRRTIRIFKAPASEEQLKKIILAGTKYSVAVMGACDERRKSTDP